jgi:hypothetical protein
MASRQGLGPEHGPHERRHQRRNGHGAVTSGFAQIANVHRKHPIPIFMGQFPGRMNIIFRMPIRGAGFLNATGSERASLRQDYGLIKNNLVTRV